MGSNNVLKNLLDTKAFRFQFFVVLILLNVFYLIFSTVSCVTSFIGISLVLLVASWKLTKLIRRLYFREKLSSKNKAVFVTGCDTGFGHSLARRLNRDGYTVFAGCLDTSALGPRNLIETASNSKSMKLLPLDVTNDLQVQAALQSITSSLSKGGLELWAVVNNAGIATNAMVEWGHFSDYQKVFDVNVLGLVRVTRAFLPLLKKSKGRVINVSSLAGRIASPSMAIYAMSKHALVAFSTALRGEMAPWGVKVCLIEPAGYRTAMTEPELFERTQKKMWSETSEEVRKDYGEACFNFTLKFLEMNDHTGDPEEVVDVMMNAICDTEPEVVYEVSGWKYMVVRRLNDYLPTSLFDKIIGGKRSAPIPKQP